MSGARSVVAHRMGDFMEFFNEDAEFVSGALGIVLTTRREPGKAKGEGRPMCGVPVHAWADYRALLEAKGFVVGTAAA